MFGLTVNVSTTEKFCLRFSPVIHTQWWGDEVSPSPSLEVPGWEERELVCKLASLTTGKLASLRAQ